MPGPFAVWSQVQRHHVRLPDVRGRAGAVTGLCGRALVVTALVGGTGAYLHAGVASTGDSVAQGTEHVSAAALHEVGPYEEPSSGPVYGMPAEGVGSPVLAAEAAPAASDRVTAFVRRPARLVHVFHDGYSTSCLTTAVTVNGAIKQAHVTVGPRDIVHPGRSTTARAGMGIHVVRVKIRAEHHRVILGYSTLRKPDAHMARGHSKVVRWGHRGLERVTYRVVLHDGRFHSRKLTERIVLKHPLAKVVRYGTKHKARASRVGRSVDALNWHALAVCESGDNPRAVGGGGQFFGLYQFTVGTWHSVGGSGSPRNASRVEQTKRAKILYGRRGSAPWPVCGGKLYT
jgi:resuscitation-promoting factor RpfB